MEITDFKASFFFFFHCFLLFHCALCKYLHQLKAKCKQTIAAKFFMVRIADTFMLCQMQDTFQLNLQLFVKLSRLMVCKALPQQLRFYVRSKRNTNYKSFLVAFHNTLNFVFKCHYLRNHVLLLIKIKSVSMFLINLRERSLFLDNMMACLMMNAYSHCMNNTLACRKADDT